LVGEVDWFSLICVELSNFVIDWF